MEIIGIEPASAAPSEPLRIRVRTDSGLEELNDALVIFLPGSSVRRVESVARDHSTSDPILNALVPEEVSAGAAQVIVQVGQVKSPPFPLTITPPAWLSTWIPAILASFLPIMVFAVIWLLRRWRDPDAGQQAEEEKPALVPSSPDEQLELPVRLKKVELLNVRSFGRLKFEFTSESPPADNGPGRWLVLLGDNGVGKSTILRSLALSLVDRELANALLQTQKTPAPYVRSHETRAEITVELAGLTPFHVEIKPDRTSEKLTVLAESRVRPALFAYGPQRGSAIGRSAREVAFSEPGAVATLFSEDAELIHAETWLKELRLGALETSGGPAEAFFEAVVQALLGMLEGVDRIEVTREKGVRLFGPGVGRDIPLAALSDGYLSTMGWILDLLARWSERFRRIEGRPPDASMALDANGLVLVDEISLHLHPHWQMRVIRDVRKIFPNVSFVVSSHHPLTLLGAGPNEVHIMRRGDDGTVSVTAAQDPRLLTGTELYAAFFDIDRLHPEDLGEKLERYARIAVNPYRSDEEDEEARELLRQLQVAKVQVKLEPVPRSVES